MAKKRREPIRKPIPPSKLRSSTPPAARRPYEPDPDLLPVDGDERQRHDTAVGVLKALQRQPLGEPRWDAAQVPETLEEHRLLDRAWIEVFQVPSQARLSMQAHLRVFWDTELSPAALLYAQLYHFPAISPWGAAPALDAGVIDRMMQVFALSRVPDPGYLALTCLSWRLAYCTDEYARPLPPPAAGTVPAWQDALEQGNALFAERLADSAT
jgi:hypothetical protein